MPPKHFHLRLLSLDGRPWAVALCLLFWLSSVCIAQTSTRPEMSVEMTTNTPRIALGESGSLNLICRNFELRSSPQINVDGLQIMQRGKSSQITIRNGERSRQVTYTYVVVGEQVGRFTIEPLRFSTGSGESLASGSVTFEVYQPDGSQTEIANEKPYFATLELAETKLYVNQVIPATLSFFVRGGGGARFTKVNFTNDALAVRSRDQFANTQTIIDGIPFSKTQASYRFFAMKPGEFDVQADIAAQVQAMNNRFGGGSGFFFNRLEEKTLRSIPVKIEVLPLPPGAPESFTNSVGEFQMLTQVAQKSGLQVGDPLQLEFIVSGVGNMQIMGAPKLSGERSDGWKVYEPSREYDPSRSSDGLNPGVVRFQQVIIPQRAHTKLPSFQLSYFNPKTERYETLESEALTVSIAEDPQKTDSQSAAASQSREISTLSAEAAEPSPKAELPEPQFSDVLYIKRTRPHWLSSAAPTFADSWSAMMRFHIIAIGLCLAIILALGFLRIHRARKLASEGPCESWSDVSRFLQGSKEKDLSNMLRQLYQKLCELQDSKPKGFEKEAEREIFTKVQAAAFTSTSSNVEKLSLVTALKQDISALSRKGS